MRWGRLCWAGRVEKGVERWWRVNESEMRVDEARCTGDAVVVAWCWCCGA